MILFLNLRWGGKLKACPHRWAWSAGTCKGDVTGKKSEISCLPSSLFVRWYHLYWCSLIISIRVNWWKNLKWSITKSLAFSLTGEEKICKCNLNSTKYWMQRFIIVFNFLEMRLARPYTEGKFQRVLFCVPK